jgi:hypothetical protein
MLHTLKMVPPISTIGLQRIILRLESCKKIDKLPTETRGRRQVLKSIMPEQHIGSGPLQEFIK